MTELDFSVTDVVPEPYAVAPNLLARIRVEERTGEAVHAMAVRCQVRIEPQRRQYDDAEEQALVDLFGGRQRFAETLRPFTWLHSSTVTPGFQHTQELELVLPCTYDVEVSGTKYLAGLEDGEVPLSFLFSGTVFTRGSNGFTVGRIPWDKEATYRMPVRVWRELMDLHFPNAAWVRLHRDTVAALGRYRSAHGLVGWDETVEKLIARAGEPTAEQVGG